jgi:hypothetical protein
MNEIYIKILAEKAKQDSTLLDKLPEDVRTKVKKEMEEAKELEL